MATFKVFSVIYLVTDMFFYANAAAGTRNLA